MKTIKVKHWTDVPINFTGIVEFENGDKEWLKNGITHRENGPSVIDKNGYKEWWLDGKCIWNSYEREEIIFTDKIIPSKEQHPGYPTVQVWKYIDGNRIREQIIIPGMEAWIIE